MTDTRPIHQRIAYMTLKEAGLYISDVTIEDLEKTLERLDSKGLAAKNRDKLKEGTHYVRKKL